MGQIEVIGGCYLEKLRLPSAASNLVGSGVRAAAVLAGLGVATKLHTCVGAGEAQMLESLTDIFGFEVRKNSIPRTHEFRYLHPLARPILWPRPESSQELIVKATNALLFGMVEALGTVHCTSLVYDPQSPGSPTLPPAGTSWERLAMVFNLAEARKLTGNDSPEEAAAALLSSSRAEVVIIKAGVRGAYVFSASRPMELVPPYLTERVYPIGSGDVFSAAFAYGWMEKGLDPVASASLASKAVALYVDTNLLPVDKDLLQAKHFCFPPLIAQHVELEAGYHLYLAGPFFNTAQRWLVEEVRSLLVEMRLKVFSPLHDVGTGLAEVAEPDLRGLRECRAVLALVDGGDPGTLFEVGYARANTIPVVALAENTSEEANKMLQGSGCDVITDLASAIYRAAWKALV